MGFRGQVARQQSRAAMSALGQKQTSEHDWVMSALPPKADIGTRSRNVRFVPKADISQLLTGRSSPRRIPYTVWYSAIAITARVSVLLGCRSSSRIVK